MIVDVAASESFQNSRRFFGPELMGSDILGYEFFGLETDTNYFAEFDLEGREFKAVFLKLYKEISKKLHELKTPQSSSLPPVENADEPRKAGDDLGNQLLALLRQEPFPVEEVISWLALRNGTVELSFNKLCAGMYPHIH